MSSPWNENDSLKTEPMPLAGQMGLTWLIGAAVATALLWQVPFGDYILYPFTILATWFHEMGHGLTAMVLGGDFEKLLIFPNGSGIAFHRGNLLLGPIGRALVAAAGPLGPPFAGAALIIASRRFQTAHYSLMFLGSLLIVSSVIWVRSWFGLLVIPILGAIVLAIAFKAPHWIQGFAIQFLGVQACVSTYHQMDYLFTRAAVVGGQLSLSDSSQIAQNLLLPYWFWGGLMAIASLALLIQSLRIAYNLDN